ncbi:MAG: hypothetical protein ABNH21_06950 [Glaciecola sp.]|jgi:hypothetical protein
MEKLRTFLIFISQVLIASLLSFVVASLMHSQTTISGLIDVGAKLSLNDKLTTVYYDFIGLLPVYGSIIFAGMLIAMPIASVIKRKLQISNRLIHCLAGAMAIVTILIAMHPILNVTLIAGARGTGGMLMQSIAGAIGGLAYAFVHEHNQKTRQ